MRKKFERMEREQRIRKITERQLKRQRKTRVKKQKRIIPQPIKVKKQRKRNVKSRYYGLVTNLINRKPEYKPRRLKKWNSKRSTGTYWKSRYNAILKRIRHDETSILKAVEQASLMNFFGDFTHDSSIRLQATSISNALDEIKLRDGFMVLLTVGNKTTMIKDMAQIERIREFTHMNAIELSNMAGSDPEIVLMEIESKGLAVEFEIYRERDRGAGKSQSKIDGAFFPYHHTLEKVDLSDFGVFKEVHNDPLIDVMTMKKSLKKVIGDNLKLVKTSNCEKDFSKKNIQVT